MKIKNKKELGLGAFCIVFAAIIAYLSMQLKATGYEGDPGPKMFPLIGSVIMAVCGIALIIAPEKHLDITTYTRDPKPLQKLYDTAIEEYPHIREKLLAFCEDHVEPES